MIAFAKPNLSHKYILCRENNNFLSFIILLLAHGLPITHENIHRHNVSIHRNCYQNQLINEYARKKIAKISESRSF